MQTKKRAKSVKFGAGTKSLDEKKEEKKEIAVKDELPSEIIPAQTVKTETNIEEKNMAEVMNKGENTNPVVGPVKEEIQGQRIQNQQTQDLSGVEPVAMNEISDEISSEQQSEAPGNAYVVETEVKKNLIRYFIIVALVSFFIGLISMAGINFILQKKFFDLPFSLPKQAEVTSTPAPTITVEPTKVVEINLSEYDIEILNGGEISGAAARLKTSLLSEGFAVISARNADSSDYTDTIISAKKNVNQAYLGKLKDSLKNKYRLGTDYKLSIPETSEADVVITIGSNVASNSAQN